MQPNPRLCFAREQAVTLVELLVVLIVLVSLAGIGLAAANGARSIAEVQRARAELAIIASAIETARTHLGAYPETDVPAHLYAILSGRSSLAGVPLSAPGRRLVDPTGLKLSVSNEADPSAHLVDPWGHAYVYRAIADVHPGGLASSFLLYSSGPDGEPGRHLGRDPDPADPAVADNVYAFR